MCLKDSKMITFKDWKETPTLLVVLLITLPIFSFFVSIAIGRYVVQIQNVLGILFSLVVPIDPYWTPTEEMVVIKYRVPRILLAMLIGAGLSVSGATFQGMFRNPLVSPYILGVASGAGFGGVLAMLLFDFKGMIMLFSFLFGVIALVIAYRMSKTGKTTPILLLVLSGVIVNALFTALISLIKYLADPLDELPSIVFWLMGSLASANYSKLFTVLILILPCICILYSLRWRLNILSLGDEDAQALDCNVEKIRWAMIICVTLIVSISVSVSGIIGWVGLAIPHIARMVVGPDHKILIPACISFGATYLVFMDDIARTLTAAEIPLGILTSIIGALIFGYLLMKTHGRGWVDS